MRLVDKKLQCSADGFFQLLEEMCQIRLCPADVEKLKHKCRVREGAKQGSQIMYKEALQLI